MKLFRVTSERDPTRWWGVVVLARDETEAACDPCLKLNNPRNTSRTSGQTQYTATEITYASLHDVEAAHHCPLFVWRFDDHVSGNREFRELEYKRRFEHRRVSELRMPEIIGLAQQADNLKNTPNPKQFRAMSEQAS